MMRKTFFLALLLLFQLSVDMQGKKSDYLEVSNGRITLRQDLTRGGGICFIGRDGRKRNYINISDEGRYIQQSYYAGQLVNRQSEGQSPSWSPWCWNPIQAGDYKRNRAKILESRCDGQSTYVKCIPMLWDMDNRPAEAEMEQWTTLKDNMVHVHCRLTCHRTDNIYGDSTLNDQEIPAVYPISSLNHLYAYRGEHPFTAAPADSIAVEQLTYGEKGYRWGTYRDVAEKWMAFIGDDGWGIGVYSPEAEHFMAGRHRPSRSGEAKDHATSYIAPVRKLLMRKNSIVDYEYYLLFGTVDEIRCAVYAIVSDAQASRSASAGEGDSGRFLSLKMPCSI